MTISIRLKTLFRFLVLFSVLLPQLMECVLSMLRKKALVISNVIVAIGLLSGEVVGSLTWQSCNASGRMRDASTFYLDSAVNMIDQ